MTSDEIFSLVDLVILVISVLIMVSSTNVIFERRGRRGKWTIFLTVLLDIVYLYVLPRTETYMLTVNCFVMMLLMITTLGISNVAEGYRRKYRREPKGWGTCSIALVVLGLASFFSFIYMWILYS